MRETAACTVETRKQNPIATSKKAHPHRRRRKIQHRCKPHAPTYNNVSSMAAGGRNKRPSGGPKKAGCTRRAERLAGDRPTLGRLQPASARLNRERRPSASGKDSTHIATSAVANSLRKQPNSEILRP